MSISKTSKDKPSPSAISAKTLKSANDSNFITPGAFTILKFSIFSFEKDFCSSIVLEAKQLIKNSYTNKKIIHSIVRKYIINGNEFLKIPEKIFEKDFVILEIVFVKVP